MSSEIYLDTETQRLSHQVPGGWNNIGGFGLAVGVTWDTVSQFRVWYEEDAAKLIDEIARFNRVITFNGERFDFRVLAAYGDVRSLYPRSFDLLVDLKRRLGYRVKLESLAQATLGCGKCGDAVLAVKWWCDGEKEKVMAYCQQDVKLLVDIVQFARANGFVIIPPKQIVRVNW